MELFDGTMNFDAFAAFLLTIKRAFSILGRFRLLFSICIVIIGYNRRIQESQGTNCQVSVPKLTVLLLLMDLENLTFSMEVVGHQVLSAFSKIGFNNRDNRILIPIALLISQLKKKVDGNPVLLRFSEAVNLFHEFGHVLGNQILHLIKEEGTFNTMRTLLIYLHMSPMDQKPAIATLLLQLDLLMSIYKEEAIEALEEAIQRKDFPSSQMTALATLSSLSGHSKKPYMECWLLRIVGFHSMMRTDEIADEMEQAQMKQEERAARTWEKRIAFVLSNHERGTIFKALEECIGRNSLEIAKSSLVVATWLVHMLYSFTYCGCQD